MARDSFDLDALTRYGESDPTGYMTDVPAAIRQLAEARSAAQTGAEVESRNRVARNFDALGSGVSFLSSPDASREEMQLLMLAQGTKRREGDAKAMAEREQQYGTPYAYEARRREAEGGVYRDDASANRMLHGDPATLLAELAGQQGNPALGDERSARLAELFGLASHATDRRHAIDDRRAQRDAKETPGDKAARYFQAEAEALKAASSEGVDTIEAAIRERAAKDPKYAEIGAKLIQSLRNRRLKDKDLEREDLGQSTIFGPDGEILGGRLPSDRAQAELLRRLRPLSPDQQTAAERGFY